MFHLKLREKQNEEGFTLIELLVVVIIIGILAAIAIPVFLNQREKAWDSAAQSTLRSIGVAQESYRTENGAFASDPVDLAPYGAPTDNDNVSITHGTATADEYCVSAVHDSGGSDNTFHVDETGVIQDGAC